MKPPYTYGDPDQLAAYEQAVAWREAFEKLNDERAKLNRIVIKLRRKGITHRRIRQLTGLGISQIQVVARKAGLT